MRKKIYRCIEKIQIDLDARLIDNDTQRPHEGRWCFGKTPLQTFLNSKNTAKEKTLMVA